MTTKPHHDAEREAIIPNPQENHDFQNLFSQDKLFLFKPRAFNIVWGNDRRYWHIPSRTSSTRSNGDEVAELVEVSWLEVTGSVTVNDSTSYQITFTLSFKNGAFGWSGPQVFLMAKVGRKGKYTWKRLKELEKLPKEPTEFPNNGDPFVVDVPKDQTDKRLYFGLYEVWSGKWKGGLKVHHAIVKEKK